MSFRFDSSLIPGAYHLGNRALGVLAALVPASGESGPGYVYNDLTLPDDANKEVRGYIESTTLPGGTLTAYEDTSFSIVGAPNGTYTITYRLYVDGVDLGTANATINIGDVVSCSFTITTDAAVFSGSALVGGSGASCSFNLSTDAATFAGSSSVPAQPGDPPTMPSPGYLITEVVRGGMRSTSLGDNPGFSPKDPEEVVALGWDFGALTDAGTSPVVTIALHSGTSEADPAGMLTGSPAIVGTKVLQRVDEGVDTCTYNVRFEINDADGNLYVREGVLPVRVK